MTEEELEKRISQAYNQAAREMEQKTTAYLESFAVKDKEKQALLEAGKISQKEYNDWKVGQVAIGKRWQTMSEQLAQEALEADNASKALIESNLPLTFAEAMNYGTFEVETLYAVDTAFTLYDKPLVLNLIKEQPTLLPQLNPESPTAKKIREGKILRWNEQKITAQVTQGIMQGESIPKIAARMKIVTDMDKSAAIRNARTATNAARQAGHDAAYERANEMGIDVQRMWIAFLDDRTRQEHRELDGQVRSVGEPFTVDDYEIMRPCDPAAEPEMVYNCRCTTIAYNPKMNITLADRNTSKLNQEYEEWKKGKKED